MNGPVCICVGHSRLVNGTRDGGAIACGDQMSEWAYNSILAPLIVSELADLRIPAIVIDRYAGTGYGAAMRWLAATLRDQSARLALELHFNDSDDPQSNGHEFLHWGPSTAGHALATDISAEMCLQLPAIRRRGVVAIGPADRGAEFLRLTSCPAVICEPFFGSNKSDFQQATAGQLKIARAIAHGIASFEEG